MLLEHLALGEGSTTCAGLCWHSWCWGRSQQEGFLLSIGSGLPGSSPAGRTAMGHPWVSHPSCKCVSFSGAHISFQGVITLCLLPVFYGGDKTQPQTGDCARSKQHLFLSLISTVQVFLCALHPVSICLLPPAADQRGESRAPVLHPASPLHHLFPGETPKPAANAGCPLMLWLLWADSVTLGTCHPSGGGCGAALGDECDSASSSTPCWEMCQGQVVLWGGKVGLEVPIYVAQSWSHPRGQRAFLGAIPKSPHGELIPSPADLRRDALCHRSLAFALQRDE